MRSEPPSKTQMRRDTDPGGTDGLPRFFSLLLFFHKISKTLFKNAFVSRQIEQITHVIQQQKESGRWKRATKKETTARTKGGDVQLGNEDDDEIDRRQEPLTTKKRISPAAYLHRRQGDSRGGLKQQHQLLFVYRGIVGGKRKVRQTPRREREREKRQSAQHNGQRGSC